MPITATLAMVAAAAMAGVPLLNGFLSKEMFFAETLFVESHRAVEFIVPVVATVAAAASVAYTLRFIHDVFFNGAPVDLPRTPHEPPRWMRIPVEVLVVVCLVVGMLPAATVGPVLAVAARATLGGTLPEYSLALWHGWNLPLLMSAVALTAGAAAYFGLQRTINLHWVTRLPVNGKHVFDALVAAAVRLAAGVTAALPFGRLRGMLACVIAAAIAAAAVPLQGEGPWSPPGAPTTPGTGDALWQAIGLVLFAVGGAAAIGVAAWYRRRLVALVLLGVVGLTVSLAFVLFSAPDLALTQLLVEVVTLLLMLLALHYLPPTVAAEANRGRRLRDAALATVAGAGAAAIALAVMTRPFDSISAVLPRPGNAGRRRDPTRSTSSSSTSAASTRWARSRCSASPRWSCSRCWPGSARRRPSSTRRRTTAGTRCCCRW